MSNQELKPCPFCGSVNIETLVAPHGHRVRCLDCDGSTGRYTHYDFAVAAWNRRPPEQPRATKQQSAEYHGGLGDK